MIGSCIHLEAEFRAMDATSSDLFPCQVPKYFVSLGELPREGRNKIVAVCSFVSR